MSFTICNKSNTIEMKYIIFLVVAIFPSFTTAQQTFDRWQVSLCLNNEAIGQPECPDELFLQFLEACQNSMGFGSLDLHCRLRGQRIADSLYAHMLNSHNNTSSPKIEEEIIVSRPEAKPLSPWMEHIVALEAYRGCGGDGAFGEDGFFAFDIDADENDELLIDHRYLHCSNGISSFSGYCGAQACSVLLYSEHGNQIMSWLAVSFMVTDHSPPYIRVIFHGGEVAWFRSNGREFERVDAPTSNPPSSQEEPHAEHSSVDLRESNSEKQISIEDAARSHVQDVELRLSVLLGVLGISSDQISRASKVGRAPNFVLSWINDQVIDRTFDFGEKMLTLPENHRSTYEACINGIQDACYAARYLFPGDFIGK